MCFERLITEVHAIKVHVVTTTDHCALRNDHNHTLLPAIETTDVIGNTDNKQV